MNIINLDINIIKALDVLLEEKNVSKAALRLGITQPAMSNALNRIRDIFSDPILVRTSAGMEPSLKALKIYPQVKRAIQELEQLFVEEKLFDPSTSEYSFNIGASDYASIIIAPILVKHLEKDHPNIRLHIHRLESDSLTQGLQSMNLDFVLGTGMRSAIPEHLFSKTLFQDQFACAMSEEFSKKTKRISLKKYLSHKHIKVSPVGLDAEIIDRHLDSLGYRRDVAMTMPHFSVAIQTLSKGGQILTLPYRVLEKMSRYVPIKVFKLPFDVDPFDVSIIWHEKTKNSQAHAWLRNQLYDLFE